MNDLLVHQGISEALDATTLKDLEDDKKNIQEIESIKGSQCNFVEFKR